MREGAMAGLPVGHRWCPPPVQRGTSRRHRPPCQLSRRHLWQVHSGGLVSHWVGMGMVDGWMGTECGFAHVHIREERG